MAFLKLGTVCAVIDREGRVLFSERGDFKVWALPGGRLDSGELLVDAAAREVREETGVVAEVQRPVGLYFWSGSRRMNVLYVAIPVGGQLRERSDETRDNRYLPLDAFPQGLTGEMARAALGAERPLPYAEPTSQMAYRRYRRTLMRRYLVNLLRGRPEPRHVRFDVQAVGVLLDAQGRVLTDEGARLPRVRCDGRMAPWEQLAAHLSVLLDGQALVLHWVGLRQQPTENRLVFVFSAFVDVLPGVWHSVDTAKLSDEDADFVRRSRAMGRDFAAAPVWTVVA